MVTSDHGELLGKYGLLYHDMNRLHEPLVHVPLVVKYPGGGQAGRRVEEKVSLRAVHDAVLSATDGDASHPIHSDCDRPEMVKVDFFGMNQTLPAERYRETYDDLDRQSRAV